MFQIFQSTFSYDYLQSFVLGCEISRSWVDSVPSQSHRYFLKSMGVDDDRFFFLFSFLSPQNLKRLKPPQSRVAPSTPHPMTALLQSSVGMLGGF